MDMAEQGTPGGTSEFDGALAPWEWPPDAGFGDLEEIETGPGESDNEFNASLNTWDEYSALVSISGTDSRLPAATDRRASNEDSVVNHGWVETRMGQETRRLELETLEQADREVHHFGCISALLKGQMNEELEDDHDGGPVSQMAPRCCICERTVITHPNTTTAGAFSVNRAGTRARLLLT